jgi:acyl-CoA thioester hydrolase
MKKQMEDPPIHKSMTIDLVVTPEHIDDRGHVNNAVYLIWVQEAANRHWHYLAGPQANDFAWVVRRHEIDYLAAAYLGDRIQAITWVGETDALSSIRRVRIQTGEGRILSEVRTTWCLIDPGSGRFRRITDQVKQFLEK